MRKNNVGFGSLLPGLLLLCGFAAHCEKAAAQPAAAPVGGLSATPLAMGRIWAGADLDFHFYLAGRDRAGTMYQLVPIEKVAVTAEVTMPSMPGMAPMTPTVHEEGAPGYYQSKFYLKPHYQLEGLTVSLRLVSKLPSEKTA